MAYHGKGKRAKNIIKQTVLTIKIFIVTIYVPYYIYLLAMKLYFPVNYFTIKYTIIRSFIECGEKISKLQ